MAGGCADAREISPDFARRERQGGVWLGQPRFQASTAIDTRLRLTTASCITHLVPQPSQWKLQICGCGARLTRVEYFLPRKYLAATYHRSPASGTSCDAAPQVALEPAPKSRRGLQCLPRGKEEMLRHGTLHPLPASRPGQFVFHFPPPSGKSPFCRYRDRTIKFEAPEWESATSYDKPTKH